MDIPVAVLRKEKEKPLPHPFIFPVNYRPEVEMCLKSGKMTKEARKQLLTSVASCMFSYKRYPTKEEFIQLAMEIIRKYPFMKSLTGTPSGAIVQTLINCFKEFRRHETVQKPSSSQSSGSTSSNIKPTVLPPPTIPAGEDETSFERQ
uniref:Uncharacterized protein n=1 Tax=Amphimedon queenslandica TaxID=400682 RepID=A0A1X7U1X0_AMPQE